MFSFKKSILAIATIAILSGCTPTLDATNKDTFKKSLDEMTANMEQKTREEVRHAAFYIMNDLDRSNDGYSSLSGLNSEEILKLSEEVKKTNNRINDINTAIRNFDLENADKIINELKSQNKLRDSQLNQITQYRNQILNPLDFIAKYLTLDNVYIGENLDNDGYYANYKLKLKVNAEVTNHSEFTIGRPTFTIDLRDKDGKHLGYSDFSINVTIKPNESSKFIFDKIADLHEKFDNVSLEKSQVFLTNFSYNPREIDLDNYKPESNTPKKVLATNQIDINDYLDKRMAYLLQDVEIFNAHSEFYHKKPNKNSHLDGKPISGLSIVNNGKHIIENMTFIVQFQGKDNKVLNAGKFSLNYNNFAITPDNKQVSKPITFEFSNNVDSWEEGHATIKVTEVSFQDGFEKNVELPKDIKKYEPLPTYKGTKFISYLNDKLSFTSYKEHFNDWGKNICFEYTLKNDTNIGFANIEFLHIFKDKDGNVLTYAFENAATYPFEYGTGFKEERYLKPNSTFKSKEFCSEHKYGGNLHTFDPSKTEVYIFNAYPLTPFNANELLKDVKDETPKPMFQR